MPSAQTFIAPPIKNRSSLPVSYEYDAKSNYDSVDLSVAIISTRPISNNLNTDVVFMGCAVCVKRRLMRTGRSFAPIAVQISVDEAL